MRSLLQLDSEQLKILNKMQFPLTTDPFSLKILWLKTSHPHCRSDECGLIPHHHRFCEIHFYLEGESTYTVNKKDIFTISKNQFIVFPPNTLHEKNKDEHALRFSLAYEITDRGEQDAVSADYLTCNTPFVGLIAPDMKELFLNIAAELDFHTPLTPYVLRNIIFNLIYRVCQQRDTSPKQLPSTEQPKSIDQRVRSAMRFIKDNLDMPLNAKNVADYTHISYKQLNRLFQCELDTTVLRYIHDQKNEKAQRLLLENNHSLGEISLAVGFENEYYFNSFFKKMNGISPGAYRKEHLSYSKKIE